MKIMFVAHQCYFDPSNGATHSMRDLFVALCRRGWDCHAFSGPTIPAVKHDELVATVVKLAEGRCRSFRRAWDGARSFSLLGFEDEGVHVRTFVPEVPYAYPPSLATSAPFLGLLRAALGRVQPDVVVMFGRDAFGEAVIAEAKRQGCAVVFALCNFNYNRRELFRAVDAVLVPSRSMADHYRTELELDPTLIPPLLNEARVVAAEKMPWFLTYVSPAPVKGIHLARHILSEVTRRRPEIPILLVQGRGELTSVRELASSLGPNANVQIMPTVADARQFYASTRVLMMPSIAEPFGMLATECFANGIPIVASRRDGLIEACREGGILIDIPKRYLESTRELAPADVTPWTEAIFRLWDDREFYAAEVRRGSVAARAFSEETLAPQYAAFFEAVAKKSPRPKVVEGGGPLPPAVEELARIFDQVGSPVG